MRPGDRPIRCQGKKDRWRGQCKSSREPCRRAGDCSRRASKGTGLRFLRKVEEEGWEAGLS